MAVYKSLKFRDVRLGDEILVTRQGGNIYHGEVVKKTDRIVGIQDFDTDAKSYFYREDSQITAHLVYRPALLDTDSVVSIRTSSGETWTKLNGLWIHQTMGGVKFMGHEEFLGHIETLGWRYV